MAYEARGVLLGLVECYVCGSSMEWHPYPEVYRCEQDDLEYDAAKLERMVISLSQTALDEADVGTVADAVAELFDRGDVVPPRKELLRRAVIIKNVLLRPDVVEQEFMESVLAFMTKKIQVAPPLPFRDNSGVLIVVRAYNEERSGNTARLML